MLCSINEVEATLTKAALGAGMPVGLAEDASRAGVWLCLHGFDGLGTLLSAIQTNAGPATPDSDGQTLVFRDARAAYCGPSAFDSIVAGTVERQVKLLGVDVPLLILGFAGVAASTYGIELELADNNGTWAHLAPDTAQVGNAVPGPGADLTIRRDTTRLEPPTAVPVYPTQDIQVDPALWRQINEFAGRTYVPASEASRKKGAGAGLVDTD